MLLVEEDPRDPNNFKVFLTVSDKLLVCNSSNDLPKVVTLPEVTEKSPDVKDLKVCVL